MLLVSALTAHHYTVEVATDGEMGLELATSSDYELIVLDWQMPKLDGITVCRYLRSRRYQRPILLLTARDADEDIVQGLDAGADDYLTKPFKIDELLARLRALQRRGEAPLLPDLLTWGQLCLNLSAAIVTYNHQKVSLTPKEYALLELFLRYPLRVFSRSVILDRLWTIDAAPSEGTVTNLIKDLRQKLKTAGMTVDPLETIYGLGYRLRKDDQTQETELIEEAQTGFDGDVQPCGTARPQDLGARSTEANLRGVEPDLTAINGLLERFREVLAARLTVLEEATQALQDDRLTPALRQRAVHEAHKLAGGLGTVGYPQGSPLALAIEQVFEGQTPLTAVDTVQLIQYLSALKHALAQPPKTLTVASEFSGTLPCVLLVDDDVVLGDRLRVEAQDWNIQLDVATDLVTAWAKIIQMPPALVLLDLNFPELMADGMEFLAVLTQQLPTLPVLVLTVRDRLSDRLQACQLGARGFLHKPIAPAQVQKAIFRTLQPQALTTRVMIVDDDGKNLTLYRDWLSTWGLQITTLQDPTQFWSVLTATQPDLLLLDLDMPAINGADLCRIVRQDGQWGELPILVVTANQDQSWRHQALMAGADDVLYKPILEPELMTRVFSRLGRYRLRQQLAESEWSIAW